MKRTLTTVLLGVSAFTLCFSYIPPVNAASAGDFRTRQSGNWGTTSTWERWNGSSWVSPAPSAPGASDGAITIQSGHTVTVAATADADQTMVDAGGELDIASGITLIVANGAGTDLTVNGTLKNNGGTLAQTGAAIVFGAGGAYEHNVNGGTIPTATWDTASNCTVTGVIDATAISGITQSFGNFTWNNPFQTANPLNLSGTLNAVTGDFTVANTGTGALAMGAGTAGNLLVSGNFVQTGGNFLLETTGAARSMTVTGNFTQSLGTLDLSGGASGNNGIVYVGGNFSFTGTLTESGSTTGSGIIFNGTGIQTFTSGGNITNRVNFTVNGGSTLQMGTGGIPATIASGTGSIFTLSSGAALGITSPAGISASGATGNIQTTTRSYSTGAGYIYDGSGGQTTGNGLPVTVSNLTVNNPAGITTLTNSTTVNTLLNLISGNITTSANNIYISSSGNVSRTSGHIVGNLKKYIGTGSPAKTFEIGDSSNYTPVDVAFNNVSVAGDLTVKTLAGDHPNISSSIVLPAKSVNRYWSITNSGITFTDYDAVFNYINPGDLDAGVNTSKFMAGGYSGGIWTYPSLGTRTSTSTRITDATTFGDFQLGQTANVAPNAPTMVSPVSGTRTNDITPLLSAVFSDPNPGDNGTTNYRIAITAANCLAGIVVESGTSASTANNNENTTWSPASSIGDDGTYYWCAQNNDDALQSAWASMGNFILDTSGPAFSMASPATNASIRSITADSAAGFTISQDLAEGTIIMTRTGGTADPDSPHTCVLTGTSLTAGTHNALDLSDTVNSCVTAQTLVNGTVYTFSFNGEDSIGNLAFPEENTGITFDTASPVFSSVAPATDATIKSITSSSGVSYGVNENLATGKIVMTRTGGAADNSSPRICTLKGSALAIGFHSGLDLSDTVNSCTTSQSLTDGAIYTFSFDGTDAAGNNATTVSTTGITFDTTAPTVTEVTPVTSPGNDTTPDYTFYTTEEGPITYSGDCSSATTSATSGNNTITFNPLSGGTHSNCTIKVTDAAGNQSTPLNVSTFIVDIAGPVFSLVSPATNDIISTVTASSAVNYTVNENMANGTIVMTKTGGAADASSPHTCVLKGTALNSGTHTALDMSDIVNSCQTAQSLVNGAIYTFSFVGTDMIGNPGTPLDVTGISFDTTPPVFSGISPATDSLINSITTTSAVNYTISKNLAEGTITVTRTGGTADSSSPHTCTLKGASLNSGAHTAINLSDTTDACQAAQSLVSGAVYTFTWNGIDTIGNAAIPSTVTGITFDDTAPMVTQQTPVTTPTLNTAPDYTFNSDEAGEVTYGGDCSSVTTSAVSGDNTITFDTLSEGTHSNCTINVTDSAGNQSTALTVDSFVIDTTAPVFSAVAPATNALINSITASSAINYTLSEEIAGGTIVMTRTGGEADSSSPHNCILKGTSLNSGIHTAVNLSNTTNSCTSEQSLVSGTIYDMTVNGTDAAGNTATPVISTGIIFDDSQPTVLLNTASPDPTNTSPIPITATFSEDVTGFDLTDIDVFNGTAGNFVPVTASNYTFDITPSAEGAVTINVSADTANDAAGNPNTAAIALSITYDSISPTVTIDSASPDPTNTSPIPFTATFNEDTADFTIDDITVGNGTASDFTGGPKVYDFNVTPTFNGTVSVDISANVAADSAGNLNTAATQISRLFDDIGPTLTAVTTVTTPSNNTTPSYTFNSTDAGPVTYDGDCSSSISVATAGDNPINFNALAEGTHGNCTITVADSVGNVSNTLNVAPFTIDLTNPTVTITAASPNPTNTSPIPVTAEFSEDVTGLDSTDIAIGNGSLSNFIPVSGTLYTFDIIPADQGNTTVDIANNVAQDTAGNPNSSATQLSRTFDNVSPSVTLTSGAPEPTNTSPIPFTATFSEDITGFDLTDITVGNGGAGDFNQVNASTYNFSVTPAGQGSVIVNIAGNLAQDNAGNTNTAAAELTRTFDSVNPTVILAGTVANPTNLSLIPMSATFSKDVADFDVTDVIVTNGTSSNFTGSGTYYTFDITPAGQGSVKVDIPAAAATDSAANASFAASQFSVTYDSIAPAITSATALDTNADGMMDRIAIVFNEALTDTAAGGNGFDVASASSHGLCENESANPDGTTALNLDFTCTIADTTVDDLTLTLSANPGIVDAAGNQSGPALFAGTSIPALTEAANPIVISTTPANNDVGINYEGAVTINFSEPMNPGSFTISDDNINTYGPPIWSNNNKTVTISHTAWDYNTTINITTDASDTTGHSINAGGNYTWSFTTGATGNLGQLTVPATLTVSDAGTDLSSGVSTVLAGNIMIDALLQAINSVTTGDISAMDLTQALPIGDQSVTAVKAVTLIAGSPITLQNPALPNTTVALVDETTIFGCSTWNRIFVLKAGSATGTAPSGFSIGNNVLEIGAPACALLLDKPATITITGMTSSVAFKPAVSNTWSNLSTCEGTYDTPTPPATPAPFGECAISDGTNTKILTYHFTSFGPLIPLPPAPPATPPATTQNTGSSGGYNPAAQEKATKEAQKDQPVKTSIKIARKPATVKAAEQTCESTGAPFADIIGDKNETAIEYMLSSCAMDGISESAFGPEIPLTRAVLTKALIKTFKLGGENFINLFDDIENDDPYAPYLLRAVKLGIINAQSVNYLSLLLLKPDDTLTRAEALIMAIKAKGINLGSYSGKADFVDVSQNDWFYRAASFAQETQIMDMESLDLNISDQVKKLSFFRPYEKITRGQMATLLFRIRDKEQKEQTMP